MFWNDLPDVGWTRFSLLTAIVAHGSSIQCATMQTRILPIMTPGDNKCSIHALHTTLLDTATRRYLKKCTRNTPVCKAHLEDAHRSQTARRKQPTGNGRDGWTEVHESGNADFPGYWIANVTLVLKLSYYQETNMHACIPPLAVQIPQGTCGMRAW